MGSFPAAVVPPPRTEAGGRALPFHSFCAGCVKRAVDGVDAGVNILRAKEGGDRGEDLAKYVRPQLPVLRGNIRVEAVGSRATRAPETPYHNKLLYVRDRAVSVIK